MHDSSSNASSPKTVAIAIAVVVVMYLLSLLINLPQKGRDLVVDGLAHAAAGHDDDHEGDDHEGDHGDGAHDEEGDHAATDSHGADDGHSSTILTPPSYATVAMFVVLLGCIALLPLFSKTEHWWESNLHRLYVAAGLGVITLLYYLLFHKTAIDGHWPAHHLVEPSAGFFQWNIAWTVFANAMLYEYIPFIVLLFSLYTISGGIRIEGDLRAHSMTNVTFILIGGALASFIGTTGAAMLLIRPLLETNRERKHVTHTVVFFIFVVCNCGGCLLPIGDPPLFLGYLRGVPFFWTFVLWKQWLVVNLLLLTVYWVWDHFVSYPKETIKDIQKDETRTTRLKITGLGLNGPLLVGVILSVAFLDSMKPLPGTDGWHPWLYLREVVQIGLVAISLWFGAAAVRAKNQFNYHAIIEVAALFCGIFICMQPALQILDIVGAKLPVKTAMDYFWATGTLSAVLDNAPTYVVFFETAKTLGTPEDLPVAGGFINEAILVGISLGAVFMGAMTYIGNGPNFMVKAIAETSGVKMPSFFGYMKYSIGVLLPVLIVTCILFLYIFPPE